MKYVEKKNTVILSYPGSLTAEQVKRIKKVFKKAGMKALVLDSGLTIEGVVTG